MKKLRICLLLLLLPALCACGAETQTPAAETGAEVPAPTAEPTPEPTPEIVTQVVLKNDNLPDDLQLTAYAACTNPNTEADTYLDTGISPTNSTYFIFEFACTSGFQTKDTWFFGCFDRDRRMFMETGYHQGQGNDAHFYTATGVQYSQMEDPAARTVAYLRPGDYRYPDMLSGRVYDSFEEPCPQHLYIFSRQHMSCEIAGTYDTPGQYDLQVYTCRIWQDGELVRDYVPCYSISTGRAGMFDLLEGRMYYSAGSGEVQQGPELLPPTGVSAVNGELRERVEPPSLPGFRFQGYYTGFQGSGEQCIDAEGNPCGNVGTEDGTVLYAYWTRDESCFEQYR